jgi:hypothetical protein
MGKQFQPSRSFAEGPVDFDGRGDERALQPHRARQPSHAVRECAFEAGLKPLLQRSGVVWPYLLGDTLRANADKAWPLASELFVEV